MTYLDLNYCSSKRYRRLSIFKTAEVSKVCGSKSSASSDLITNVIMQCMETPKLNVNSINSNRYISV